MAFMCEQRNLCLQLLNTLPLNINLNNIYKIITPLVMMKILRTIIVAEFTTFIDICNVHVL
jgi:hypothetical protein